MNKPQHHPTDAEPLRLNIVQRTFIWVVRIYQWLISPFLGNNCRFHPSCSSYCIEAMETRGVIKGLWLGIRRVLRCHPYCEGGYDPVPAPQQTSGHRNTHERHDPADRQP